MQVTPEAVSAGHSLVKSAMDTLGPAGALFVLGVIAIFILWPKYKAYLELKATMRQQEIEAQRKHNEAMTTISLAAKDATENCASTARDSKEATASAERTAQLLRELTIQTARS